MGIVARSNENYRIHKKKKKKENEAFSDDRFAILFVIVVEIKSFIATVVEREVLMERLIKIKINFTKAREQTRYVINIG